MKRLKLVIEFSIALLLAAAFATAGTVRGQLVTNGHPAYHVAVTVNNNYVRSAPAVTGTDGMYYLYNVGPGYWNLEIWNNGINNPPMTFTIMVNNAPLTDIKPIYIPSR